MGSKRRIAKELIPIMMKDRKEGQWYVEPFAGGCNMIEHATGNRIANDSNEYIIEMWKALVNDGWQPPTHISEDEYKSIKANKDDYPKCLVGFTGIAMAFGSNWFGTYARNRRGTNYAMEGRDNLMKQVERLKGTVFVNESYSDLKIPEKSIIYCDPPYAGVAGYKDKFHHDTFWQWCRNMANDGHTLFISEYNAPDDFECVWSFELKSNMNAKYETKPIEKLFIFNP